MIQTLVFQAGEPTSPVICPASVQPQPVREPLKHLLIGSPVAVRQTIHQLHHLGYAEAGLWSPLTAVPQAQLMLNPGEVMSILMRYLRVE